MFKAFIFDMDGVIIDSEPMHLQVEKEFFKDLGVSGSEGFLSKYFAVNLIEMLNDAVKFFGLKNSKEQLFDQMIQRKMKFFQNADLKPIKGIKELILYLKNKGLKTALASSSNINIIHAVLKQLDYAKYFDCVLSGEQVKRGKPEPDIFLTTAAKLDVDPSCCIVLEDSMRGVRAAKKAGMRCLGYFNPNSGDQDLSLADHTFYDMEDVLPYIKSLL